MQVNSFNHNGYTTFGSTLKPCYFLRQEPDDDTISATAAKEEARMADTINSILNDGKDDVLEIEQYTDKHPSGVLNMRLGLLVNGQLCESTPYNKYNAFGNCRYLLSMYVRNNDIQFRKNILKEYEQALENVHNKARKTIDQYS